MAFGALVDNVCIFALTSSDLPDSAPFKECILPSSCKAHSELLWDMLEAHPPKESVDQFLSAGAERIAQFTMINSDVVQTSNELSFGSAHSIEKSENIAAETADQGNFQNELAKWSESPLIERTAEVQFGRLTCGKLATMR